MRSVAAFESSVSDCTPNYRSAEMPHAWPLLPFAAVLAPLIDSYVCLDLWLLLYNLMSNSTIDIAIVNGARTPMGRYCGKLRDFTSMDLGAIAAKEAMQRSGVEPGEIDHVVIGNAQQTSGDSIYGARHVALKAGVPIETPALTVNRLCGSGMQSIVSAAQMIQLGEAKIALAGGMESMSQAPHVIHGIAGASASAKASWKTR